MFLLITDYLFFAVLWIFVNHKSKFKFNIDGSRPKGGAGRGKDISNIINAEINRLGSEGGSVADEDAERSSFFLFMISLQLFLGYHLNACAKNWNKLPNCTKYFKFPFFFSFFKDMIGHRWFIPILLKNEDIFWNFEIYCSCMIFRLRKSKFGKPVRHRRLNSLDIDDITDSDSEEYQASQ